MIVIESLTVRFGGVVPIDDMNLVLDVGVNGLIGPNGAGKTTFFNVMSGFVKPAEGSVTAFGDDLLALQHFRRVRWGLRRTFQTEQAVAELTVFENVLTVLEHSGSPASSRRRAVIDAVEFVGLGPLLNQPVGALGAAERRLVEVARAVVGSPRLVLLDEPAAGVPKSESAALFDVIAALPEDISILFIEHDMNLVFSFASSITVLVQGAILTEGTPDQIAHDPRVREVYLGSAHHG